MTLAERQRLRDAAQVLHNLLWHPAGLSDPLQASIRALIADLRTAAEAEPEP